MCFEFSVEQSASCRSKQDILRSLGVHATAPGQAERLLADVSGVPAGDDGIGGEDENFDATISLTGVAAGIGDDWLGVAIAGCSHPMIGDASFFQCQQD